MGISDYFDTYVASFNKSPIACLILEPFCRGMDCSEELYIRFSNKSATAYFGLSADELAGHRLSDLPTTVDRSVIAFFEEPEVPDDLRSHLFINPDGRYVFAACFSHNEARYCFIVNLTDRDIAGDSFKQLDIYRAIEPCGVFSVRLDEHFTLLYANDRYYSLIGYTPASLKKRLQDKLVSIVFPDDLPFLRRTLDRAISDGKSGAQWLMRIISGERQIKHLWIAAIFEKQPDGYMVMNAAAIDVTEQKSEELRLFRNAGSVELDSLTGLFCHTSTLERISDYLSGAEIKLKHALFMLAIDNLSLYNARFGHAKGDDAIAEVADIIKKTFRSIDIIGRTGGGEFLILMKNIPCVEIAMLKADELLETLKVSNSAAIDGAQLTVSVGALFMDGDSRPVERLYCDVHNALASARDSGGNTYRIISQDMALPAVDSNEVLLKNISGNIQLRALLEYMDGGVVLVEVSERIRLLFASPSFEHIIHNGSVDFHNPDSMLNLIHPEDLPDLMEHVRLCATKKTLLDHSFRTIRRDKSTGWVRARAVLIPYEQSIHPVMIAVVTDITQQKQLELALAESRRGVFIPTDASLPVPDDTQTVLIVDDSDINRQLLRKLLEDEYIIVEAADGPTALNILRTKPVEINAVIIDWMMPMVNGRAFFENLRKISAFSELPVLVVTGSKDDRAELAALQCGALDYIQKPYEPKIIRQRLQNAIARSRMNAFYQYKQLAEYDSLTKIYNKQKFLVATREMLLSFPEMKFVFVRIDVNRFSLINKYFGKAEGDRLLCYIADKMKILSTVNHPATYGRMFSDQFCFCVEYTDREVFLSSLSEQLRAVLNDYALDYELSVRCGVYFIEDKSLSVDDIYERSVLATSLCGSDAAVSCAVYDETTRRRFERYEYIKTRMEAALADNQFTICLQPKVRLSDGAVVGAEALARWESPDEGLIMPDEFIPVFERNGFITKLDLYVTEQVCRLLSKWSSVGLSPYPISINLSNVDLYRQSLLADIDGIFTRYGTQKRLVQFEISESAFTDNPAITANVVSKLRSRGISILLENFGNEHSSLIMLKDMTVDMLKVDMRFAGKDRAYGRAMDIIAAVIQMARSLQIPTVAEGVETNEQSLFLRKINCEYAQGFIYSQPLSIEQYEKLLV